MPARRILRALLGAVLAAAVVVPTTASATSAQPDRATALAGHTVITADHSSRMFVRLPHAVRISYARGWGSIAGMRISGAGRIVGLALVSAAHVTHPGFAELRHRACFTAACTTKHPKQDDALLEVDWGAPFHYGNNPPPTSFTLPADTYQLSVFTDGAPIRITWQIPGLSGRKTLHPLLDQRSHETSPPERSVAGGPTPVSVQSTGSYSLLTDVTVLGFVHEVKGSLHVDDDSWWCVYQNSRPPGGVMTKGCPGGDGSGVGGTYLTRSFGGMGYGVSVSAGPGSAGSFFQGVDETGAEMMSDAHDTLFWADAGVPTQH